MNEDEARQMTPKQRNHEAIQRVITAAGLVPMNYTAGYLRGKTVQLTWEICRDGCEPAYGEMYVEVKAIGVSFMGSEHPLVRIWLNTPTKHFRELYWYWDGEDKGHWIQPNVSRMQGRCEMSYEISIVLLER